MTHSPRCVDSIENKYAKVQQKITKAKTFEEFGKYLDEQYHSCGHNIIAEACRADPKKEYGIMSYSEVSARDPIFYRWHSHIEDIAQQFRNTKPM